MPVNKSRRAPLSRAGDIIAKPSAFFSPEPGMAGARASASRSRPYTKEVFEASFEWIRRREIFDPASMGSGKYEAACVSLKT